MSEKPLSCVLLADRHHGLTEGVRGLLETVFGTVVMAWTGAQLAKRKKGLIAFVFSFLSLLSAYAAIMAMLTLTTGRV